MWLALQQIVFIDLVILNRSATCHLIFFANPKLTELLHLVVSVPSCLKEDSYLAKVHFEFGTMSMSELIIAVF